MKWTETRDRKDESRSWNSHAIDPISMSVINKQATGTLHRHFKLFPDLFRTSTSTEGATVPFVRIDVPQDGDCALYCASANHSRTSSSSSLPDLVGFSSSSGESSDDELPELESIEDGAVECRKCRPFPASNGCRPCRFSWPDLDLDQAARSSGESSDDDMPELESLFCVLADAARDARPLCSDILSFEHRSPELN